MIWNEFHTVQLSTMFHQIHGAVENFTTQLRTSTDAPSAESLASTSSSVDAPLDPTLPSQLADSVSSLRKLLTVNHTGTSIAKSTSLPIILSDKPRRKLNLDERLRASLSAVDFPTTSSSSPTTQPRISVLEETTYAASIPIPDSPIMPLVPTQIPIERSDAERSGATSETQAHNVDSAIKGTLEVDGEQASSPAQANLVEGAGTDLLNDDVTRQIMISNNELTPLEEDGALDRGQSSPTGIQHEEDTSFEASESRPKDLQEHDTVEVLQRRLKEVEKRFSGKFLPILCKRRIQSIQTFPHRSSACRKRSLQPMLSSAI